MFRRLAVVATTVGLCATGTWKLLVAEYFGHVDIEAWAAEHPSPPAPRAEPGAHRVSIISTRRIVPSPGLDSRFVAQTANNNLDVIRHQGRVYLAWRSAPSHFAGSETAIHVASSADERQWSFEASFHTGHDLREPRLASLGDRLLLYVSRLGDNPFDFTPDGISVSERTSDGGWSQLERTGPKGAIAWRIKQHQGQALMVLYRGGENLYAFNGEPMTVELWRSSNGRDWRPFSEQGAVVLRGGGTETDFAIDRSGELFAVVRNEAGDVSGSGSKLCRGSGVTLGAWRCKTDHRKYDSPLVFEHDGEVYVVGRRNLSGDGRYDVSTDQGPVGIIQNELAYITTAKRCALWRWIKAEERLGFVLDLPSRGDTCFPSRLDSDDPSRVIIYDYSSDIEGPELPWSAGQRRETYVYRHELALSRGDPPP
ncbi:MAG TPA: hypothetical protein VJN18_34075 [Polyangiaceae bacterium]|nr:hypothetical protein [Polyangiaceae bacterium]